MRYVTPNGFAAILLIPMGLISPGGGIGFPFLESRTSLDYSTNFQGFSFNLPFTHWWPTHAMGSRHLVFAAREGILSGPCAFLWLIHVSTSFWIFVLITPLSIAPVAVCLILNYYYYGPGGYTNLMGTPFALDATEATMAR